MEDVEWYGLSSMIQLRTWDQSHTLTAVIMSLDGCRVQARNAHGCGGPVFQIEIMPRAAIVAHIHWLYYSKNQTYFYQHFFLWETPIVKVGQPVQRVFACYCIRVNRRYLWEKLVPLPPFVTSENLRPLLSGKAISLQLYSIRPHPYPSHAFILKFILKKENLQDKNIRLQKTAKKENIIKNKNQVWLLRNLEFSRAKRIM